MVTSPSPQLRVLVLVTAGYSPPFPHEMAELHEQGQVPRVWVLDMPFRMTFADQRLLAGSPLWRRCAYRLLPVWVSQVVEAYIAAGRHDVVFSWGAERVALPLACLLKITHRRLPFVALFGWISPRPQRTLLRFCHSYIDYIILPPSVQRAFAADILGISSRKTVASNYGVDAEFWRPEDADQRTICAAGREMRDYQTLIQALEGTGIPCHIAGAIVPGAKNEWRRILGDHGELITLPPNVTVGPRSPIELRKLYARSRFVVIPLTHSDTDNGITCMLEAWAMGRAVICSAIEGQKDALVHGKTGLLVPVGDVQALRTAILYLWLHPEESRRMGQAGRQHVEVNHRLSSMARSVSEAIQAAADTAQG
jgi:glycosyltransferase involved in cell wall biosynthesis